MSIKNDLPDPITRTEQYLSKAATGEGETPAPITRTEQYLDAIAQGGGGGFTPTQDQLDAMNSGINASLVARTILAPLFTPTEPVLLGVDDTNAEAQFKLGEGLEIEGNTSPYTIKASGEGMPISQNDTDAMTLEWDKQYYNHQAGSGTVVYTIDGSIHQKTDVHEIRLFQYPYTTVSTIKFRTSGNVYFKDGTQEKTFDLRATTASVSDVPDIVEFSIINMATITISATNVRTFLDIASRRLADE